MKFSTTLTTILAAIAFPLAAVVAQPSLKKFDINPNGPSKPVGLAVVANKLFFGADDGVHGPSVMSFDGTFIKLEPQLKNIVSNICEVNGKIYLAINDSTVGAELFEYDGVNPPVLVKDVYPGQSGSYPRGLIALNNVLYFQANVQWPYSGQALYSYDPASGQLQMIYSGAPHAGGTQFFEMIAHKKKLFFTSQEYTPGGMGHGLYSYDPATNQVDTIMAVNTNNGQLYHLSSDNGGLYFLYNTPAYGSEIYKYDGSNPPVRLTNFNSPSMKDVGAFVKLNDQLVSFVYEMGKNLYVVSFNETLGTSSLIDTAAHMTAFRFGLYNNRVYYSTDVQATWPSAGMPVFIYDGVTTRRLSDFVNNAQTVGAVQQFQVYKGELYFPATDNASSDEELYKFNDANLGVSRVNDIISLAVHPNPAATEATISFALKHASNLNVQLTDMQGRVVYSTTGQYNAGKHEAAVPVGELAAGVYICTVADADGVVLGRGKLVKQ